MHGAVEPHRSLYALMRICLSGDVQTVDPQLQGDTKKRELLKTPTKIEEIEEKNLLTENEPLQLAF